MSDDDIDADFAEIDNHASGRGIKGVVYVASNPAMPGLLKIGYTRKADSYDRMIELSAPSGVPKPFQKEIEFTVRNASSLELEVHRDLDRYRDGKEFFRVDLDTVRKSITRCAGDDIIHIDDHSRTPKYKAAPTKFHAAPTKEMLIARDKDIRREAEKLRADLYEIIEENIPTKKDDFLKKTKKNSTIIGAVLALTISLSSLHGAFLFLLWVMGWILVFAIPIVLFEYFKNIREDASKIDVEHYRKCREAADRRVRSIHNSLTKQDSLNWQPQFNQYKSDCKRYLTAILIKTYSK